MSHRAFVRAVRTDEEIVAALSVPTPPVPRKLAATG
jgi:hypothetical protein